MEIEKLKSAAWNITMPEEMKNRIAGNCKSEWMRTRKGNMMRNNFVKRPAAVIAAVVICLTLSLSVMAATGALEGVFVDIRNFGGAIVGTAYEQATGEITFDASVDGNELIVFAGFADPEAAPYSEAEQLGIAEYRILDENNGVVKVGSVEAARIIDGHAVLKIGIDDLKSGSYKLMVSAFVAEKKADQPLNLYGNWEFNITK